MLRAYSVIQPLSFLEATEQQTVVVLAPLRNTLLSEPKFPRFSLIFFQLFFIVLIDSAFTISLIFKRAVNTVRKYKYSTIAR